MKQYIATFHLFLASMKVQTRNNPTGHVKTFILDMLILCVANMCSCSSLLAKNV